MDNNELIEIKEFLDGKNDELKYIVNVEANKYDNIAHCVIHKPNGEKFIEQHKYTPFLYVKDFKKEGIVIYNNNVDLIKLKIKQYGIEFTKLKTANQKRLEGGYTFRVSSSISFNSILDFYRDGGIYIYENDIDERGRKIVDEKGNKQMKYRELFYYVSQEEQFLINRKVRLFKGIDFYENLHKLTFDIETQGLRNNIHRIFAIALHDNKGFKKLLEVEKEEDDDSERKLIKDFFACIDLIKPAVISGYNSEEFDFDFIIQRASILGIDLTKLKTTLSDKKTLRRNNKATVKIGGETLNYVSTVMWGYTVIDIMHSVRKTMVINTDIKEYGLKYISKFENVARENRMYINGDDNGIYHIWLDNKISIINPNNNNYIIIPDEHQKVAETLLKLENTKKQNLISVDDYETIKNKLFLKFGEYKNWLDTKNADGLYSEYIFGRDILRQYVLDDVYETHKIDELYNQSSFLLNKMIPTTFYRACTMGTASIWNLILTAWSYENDIAIPTPDEKIKFTGGLSRCFKRGYAKNIVKIDFASLYPMIQLTYNVFPMFDITNIIKRILVYFTTTRNIYKKMANGSNLNDSEMSLLELSGFDDIIKRYKDNTLTDIERGAFSILQAPIKTVNNSLFGALGSGYSFNWSDNTCAGRITTVGRLELRSVIDWFSKYGCDALLCVTDGVNFSIPDTTNIIVDGMSESVSDVELSTYDAWKFNGKTGVSALIEKYNAEIKLADSDSLISVDNDGEFKSCLNLKRNNYALYKFNKKKSKYEIKYIGGMIKSKIIPIYIEEFIDKGLEILLNGNGDEFVKYYHEYVEDIFYNMIPLRKIATKKRVKDTIHGYINRGFDKKGNLKAKKAHMELIIKERCEIIKNAFINNFNEIKSIFGEDVINKLMNGETIDNFLGDTDLLSLEKYVLNWIPNAPELDSSVYIVNTGYNASSGDSKLIIDNTTGEERFASTLITKKSMEENPDLVIEYNVAKYLNNFNNKVLPLLQAFDDDVAEKILVGIKKNRYKDELGNKKVRIELIKNVIPSNELKMTTKILDSVEDAMKLEKSEILFWNKTGYNPDLIWKNYIVDDNTLRYDIYQNALNYLNDMMIKSGKKPIKKIDDKRVEGDLILIKHANDFSLGFYNGKYVEIVRDSVEIPNLDVISVDDDSIDFEDEFKLKFKLNQSINLKELIDANDDLMKEYKNFIKEMNEIEEVEIED